MTPYRRNAWISLTCAVSSTGSATFFATTPHWPGTLIASYVAVMSAWYSRVQFSRNGRAREEAEWWRRTKLGVKQAPLSPCCLRFGDTGLLHDEVRCTRDLIPELWVEPVRIEEEWKALVADLGDLNQEEEA